MQLRRTADLARERAPLEEAGDQAALRSVANLTRRDVEDFLLVAARVPIRPEVREYPLGEANRALLEPREGRIRGAKGLVTG